MAEFELVVARYRENLNWLRRVPRAFEITIYDKNGDDGEYPQAHPLPNIGREAHTYLQHILNRYESLPPYTVFCQGHPFDHAFDFHHTLRAMASGQWQRSPFFWLGHIADTDTPEGALFASWSKNPAGHGLDLAAFHHVLFGEAGPSQYPYFLGGQFVVSRETIQERSLDFYRHALEISTTFPEAAHCYERCWDRVFDAQALTLQRMNGLQTLYLKPIKRLCEISRSD